MLYLVGSAEAPPAALPLLPPPAPLPLDALLSEAGLLSLAQRALPSTRCALAVLCGWGHKSTSWQLVLRKCNAALDCM